jgi:hypothetical protein
MKGRPQRTDDAEEQIGEQPIIAGCASRRPARRPQGFGRRPHRDNGPSPSARWRVGKDIGNQPSRLSGMCGWRADGIVAIVRLAARERISRIAG